MGRLALAGRDRPPSGRAASSRAGTRPNLRDLASARWLTFVREFNEFKRITAPRLTEQTMQARLHEVMGDSSRCFTFLHTNHPGDMCVRFGSTWVLGAAFCDAVRIRSLVTRLLHDPAQ